MMWTVLVLLATCLLNHIRIDSSFGIVDTSFVSIFLCFRNTTPRSSERTQSERTANAQEDHREIQTLSNMFGDCLAELSGIAIEMVQLSIASLSLAVLVEIEAYPSRSSTRVPDIPSGSSL